MRRDVTIRCMYNNLVVCRASNRPTTMWIVYMQLLDGNPHNSRTVNGPPYRLIFPSVRLFVHSVVFQCFILR
jgi:hypothetical protein